MNNNVEKFLSEVFGEVRVEKDNLKLWFCASDIAKVLNYSSTQKITDKVDDEDKDYRTFYTNRGKQNMVCINKVGLHKVLSTARKIDIVTRKNIYNWLTGEEFFNDISNKCPEREFIRILDTIIKSFIDEIEDWRNDYLDYIEQYKVLNYKIDIFFKNAKIIVEYDEKYHDYQKEEDYIRMNDIMFELLKNKNCQVEYEDEEGYINYIDKKDFCYMKHNQIYKLIRIKKNKELEGTSKVLACVLDKFIL